MKVTAFLLSVAALLASPLAQAECAFEGSGSVSILSNDFPALNAVNGAAKECASDALSVSANETTEHRDIQVEALKAQPANFNVVICANSSIVPLLNGGLIRPLDDLVAKYGSHLAPSQLVTVDGKIMAIAFMANAQHLMYRSDLLEAVGLETPGTYDEILAAAEAIRSAGLMQYPLTGTYKAGWNLGEEFVNLYLGLGGEFFEPGTAVAAIQNEKAVAALDMMKKLTGYMHPDYLTFDLDLAAPHLLQNQSAMANLWGSRGGAILDPANAAEGVAGNIALAAAASVGGGSVPASTLWWDGFTIATNQSDEAAETAFRVMMEAVDDEMVGANNEKAVWLHPAYVPTPAAAGVFATAEGGAAPYPMLPYMGLLHIAFGSNLADFLQGEESAEQTLADIDAAYTAAAKEAGFL